MAIPAGITRVQLSGHLASSERWVSSFWVTGRTAADASDASAAAIVASPVFTVLMGVLRAIMATDDGVDDLDLYFYSGGTGAAAHGHATVIVTGSSANLHPKQIAAVMTMRTAVGTRRTRGRMYLPATAAPMAPGGLFNNAQIDSIVDKLTDWLAQLKAAGSIPVVLSKTSGTTQPITSVDADYVPDTQRRRRNKLTSARHSHVV